MLGPRVGSPLHNALPLRPDSAPLLVVPAGGKPGRWRAEVGGRPGEAAMDCVAAEAEVDTPVGRRPGLVVTMTEVDPAGPPDVIRWTFARGVGLVRLHVVSRRGEFLTELREFRPSR